MPRRSPDWIPCNRLGRALLERRAGRRLQDVAEEVGVNWASLARFERGTLPNLSSALLLARWLAWSVEDVAAAAKEPS